MTTIEQHSQYATLINVFIVEPDRAADLAALLVEATGECDAASAGIQVGQYSRQH